MTDIKKLADDLIKDCDNPIDLFNDGGFLDQLKAKLIESAMNCEMDEHLGYEKHDTAGNNSGNSRNGNYKKTVKTKTGEVEIKVPRDRNGEFEPKIIPKNQRRFTGFDDLVISLYGNGFTTRDIQNHIKEMYKVDISPSLVSQITEEIVHEATAWRNRELKSFYCFVFLDAIFLKVREDQRVVTKPFYVAIGVDVDGKRDVLGLWAGKGHGSNNKKVHKEHSSFWFTVLNELKNRGVEDILIICIDGLRGFPEVIKEVFPDTEIQLCIVHMIRNTAKYIPNKFRKEVLGDLKPVYRANNEEHAQQCLENFESKWGSQYPLATKSWRKNWSNLVTFLQYGKAIKQAIYTTNAIESINMCLRRIIKTRTSFNSEQSAYKLLYLGLKRKIPGWRVNVQSWSSVLAELNANFEERMPK